MPAVSLADLNQPPPSRRWYAVAVVVAVLGLLASAAVLATGIRSWIGDFPALGGHFRSDESVHVDLRAGQPVVLYVSPDTAPLDWQCTAELAGSQVAITETPYTFTFFSGGRSWAARYEVQAERDGRAQLTCVATAGTDASLLAVGDKPDNSHLLRKLAGTIAAGMCTALLGLALGGTLALVVRKRRKAHRSSAGPGLARPMITAPHDRGCGLAFIGRLRRPNVAAGGQGLVVVGAEVLFGGGTQSLEVVR